MSYEPGLYLGEIVSSGFIAVGAKKTPSLKIVFKVVAQKNSEGQFEELDQVYTRNIDVWMSEKAAARSIEKLKAATGWDGDDLGEWHGEGPVGWEIEVECRGKDDSGYDSFDLPRVGGGEAQAVKGEDAVAKLIRNKYNKLLRKPARTVTRTRRTKPSDEPVTRSNEEVDSDVDEEEEVPF